MPGDPIDTADGLHVTNMTDTVSWDRYVDECPDSRWGHRAAARTALEEGLGHRCHYLEARRDAAIVGVLPLAHVRSRLFGSRLSSLPFIDVVGPLSDDVSAHDALISAAVALAEDLGVEYLELRNDRPREPEWPSSELYEHFMGPIPSDLEDTLGGVAQPRRSKIRSAMREGFRFVNGLSPVEFHRVFVESVGNLGTPVVSQRFFDRLCASFGNDADVVGILDGADLVAASVCIYQHDVVTTAFSGATASGRARSAYDLLYWRIMQHSALQGAAVFDFGRSKVGTGAHSYKRHWGFVPAQLHYEYRLVRADRPPSLNPLDPRFARRIALWKRLPVALTRVIGPPLARSLG